MRTIHFDTDFYRRNLPHLQRVGASYFVTFRLADSIPIEAVQRLNIQQSSLNARLGKQGISEIETVEIQNELKRHFARFDELLDRATSGPFWLKDKALSCIVYDRIMSESEEHYRLDCFTIMSNHVHVVLTPVSAFRLDQIMRRIKQPTSYSCNKLLQRKGAFWQEGSYDRIIREREWARIIWYVLNNPVKAGLAARWQDWPWTYLSPDILGFE
jgi:putative transposase